MSKTEMPSIRFYGFDNDWEQRKLGDIVERVVRKNTNNESSLPLTISAQYGLVDQITYFNNRVASRDVSNYYLVLNGEFAYNKSTSDGFPFGAVKRLDLYEKGVLSTLYIVFSIKNQSEIDSDYLTVFFDTDRWHKGVSERAAEGARNHGLLNISADDFFDIDIFLPRHKEEQVAIGSYLRHLDHLITLHQRKLEKLTNVKKSMLEKMFPRNGSCYPEIRFKGFTDPWEQRKLASLCEKFTDGDWIESKDQSDFGVRLVQTGNVGVAEYLDKPNNKKWISEDTFDRLHCEEVIPGDILISRLPEPAGRACIMPLLGTKMITAVDCTIVRTAPDMSNKFLVQYLSSQAYFDDVNTCLAGGTRQRISRGNLANFNVPIPVKKTEQDAIGMFFGYLDNLITLHQRKFEKLTNVKKSMLEKMFPQNGSSYPEIRFKGFTDPWEQREVGDLLIERSQQAPMSDEYPLMAFIANEGVAPKGERYDRSALVTDTVNKLYKKTEKGDFIYSSNNLETGSIGLNKYGKACISPVYSIFEPTGIADSDFLGRRLVRKDFINAMVKWRQGVIYGQWRIHESDFLKIEISVPSVEEQRKIGAYLDQLDNLITLHQRELEKLQNIKKSMLEKMFV